MLHHLSGEEFLVVTDICKTTLHVLHCSSQHQQHYIMTLQMNFSVEVIVKSSRSPFPRFLSSKWCSVNFFGDVFLLWQVSHPVIARKERISTSGIVSFRRSQILWIAKYLGFLNVRALVNNCLQLILSWCENKRKKTSVF